MRYPRFEILALTVGAISILMGVAATLWTEPIIEEIVAQGLLLVVLVGAVHRGRRGGFIAALFAIMAYLCMRVPLLVREGPSSDVLVLVLARVLTYAIMGVGGGILCSRIHHFLARFESTSNIDGQTQLFNERFITHTLRSMVRQYERFHKPFSVAVLSIPDYLKPKPGSDALRSLRAAATHLRDNVRLIDDVARLDDGRLLLVFPQTGKAGAHIAVDRIRRGLIPLLRVSEDTVRFEVLGAEEDLGSIKELCGYPARATERSEGSEAIA